MLDCLVNVFILSHCLSLWVSRDLHLNYLRDWQPAKLSHILLFHVANFYGLLVDYFYRILISYCLILSIHFLYLLLLNLMTFNCISPKVRMLKNLSSAGEISHLRVFNLNTRNSTRCWIDDLAFFHSNKLMIVLH